MSSNYHVSSHRPEHFPEESNLSSSCSPGGRKAVFVSALVFAVSCVQKTNGSRAFRHLSCPSMRAPVPGNPTCPLELVPAPLELTPGAGGRLYFASCSASPGEAAREGRMKRWGSSSATRSSLFPQKSVTTPITPCSGGAVVRPKGEGVGPLTATEPGHVLVTVPGGSKTGPVHNPLVPAP